jgi:RHS repeat-associated protein
LAFDAAGRQVRRTNPLGKISTSVYDGANRQVATIDALGNRSSFVFDAASRQVRSINALGNISTTVYDAANRQVGNVDALGNRTSTSYDAAGRSRRVTDALGRITTSLHDANGHLQAVINANGARTTQVYDAVGQQIALIDGNAHRTSFSFDAAGRQSRTTDALGNRITSTFDAASRQTLRIDGRGLRTTFVYDAANRPIGRRYADGTRVTLGYDVASRRTVLNDSTGRSTSAYDGASRQIQTISPAGLRLTYSYDAASQRSYLIEPEGLRFTYVFDAAGRISRLLNPQSQITSWGYDSASRRTSMRLANGTRASYSYDNADRLSRLANLGTGGSTLSSFQYMYDAVGNRTRVVEANGDRVSWSYDKTDQITREWRSGANAYAITYAYDSVGNRLTKKDGGALTSYSYDTANQTRRIQDSTGNTTYTFDGAGNLSLTKSPTNQRTSYTWDGEERLAKVKLPSGVANTFTYNGDGQRAQKQDSTGTTKYVWDARNIVLETDGTNSIQAVYTCNPEIYRTLVSVRRSTSTSFYLLDGLGSTIQLANTTGAVTDTYLYDSFGNNIFTSGAIVNPFRYLGARGLCFEPDLGQYNSIGPRYDPVSGRFIGPDPRGSALMHTNPYAFSGNNPAVLHGAPVSGSSGVQVITGQCASKPECGRTLSTAHFNVVNERTGAGTIIQHVTIQAATINCESGQLVQPTGAIEYYEAWEVDKGVVIPSETDDQGNRTNDNFLWCGTPNSCGSVSFRAEVAFFPDYQICHCAGYALGHKQCDADHRATEPECWIRTPPPKGPVVPCSGAARVAFPHPAGILWRIEISGSPNAGMRKPKVWGTVPTDPHNMDRTWNCCTDCGGKPQEKCPAASSPTCVPSPKAAAPVRHSL